ncbi:DUF4249 domain-containing protein [Hymenobacter busanensis]|uniref:DUF4249 domain-containing protein n=1 Tax=Hymenobacter busanensis TaxID=2607656 RepID=A0A7L5A1M5_9BACT|nr:DUF4249 domain-containing protein [Hymenobacter busanensis]KAA9338157.1 DUF4249 domain-containing protein [Hymenobacter busanensis]QHJ09418.1 DUF4249 family protein [Hymenobacter busanensis]
MRTLFSVLQNAVVWLSLLVLGGCVDEFDPQVPETDRKFLVVDGFINSKGITTIKLSYTFGLKSAAAPPVETRAKLYIEAEGGTRYNLTEGVAGTYTTTPLTLDPAQKYRLHFTTAAGQEFASDYTTVKTTPNIDALTWKQEADGVQVYLSTHDASKQSVYYRWVCDETWEFTSRWNSMLEYLNNQMVFRQEQIFHCWRIEPNTAIRLGNTARLSQDVVAEYPLLKLPISSGKLRIKYSVLVTQYAQTREEYEYWEMLRKNTESIGTLFDPLPSQVTGNVRCLSQPETTVLGYIGAYSATQQRIFIGRDELPREWIVPNVGYEECLFLDSVEVRNAASAFRTKKFLPVDGPMANSMGFQVYTGATAECVDCRLRGTNVRPAFWR